MSIPSPAGISSMGPLTCDALSEEAELSLNIEACNMMLHKGK